MATCDEVRTILSGRVRDAVPTDVPMVVSELVSAPPPSPALALGGVT